MKHDDDNNQWLSNRIMESIKDCSEEMRENVCKIADGKPLHELDIETLRRIFDMIVSSKVR